MLTLTENASTIIKTLTQQTAEEGAGLRIATGDGSDTLAVNLSTAPELTDQVVESDGARVFLEQEAAALLADKRLDAQLDQQGAVTFAIGSQQ